MTNPVHADIRRVASIVSNHVELSRAGALTLHPHVVGGVVPTIETLLANVIPRDDDSRWIVDMFRAACDDIDVTFGVPQTTTASALCATVTSIIDRRERMTSAELSRMCTSVYEEVVDITRSREHVHVRRLTRDTLTGVIKSLAPNVKPRIDITAMALELVDIVGLTGRVEVAVDGSRPRPVAIVRDGYNFDSVAVPWHILTSIKRPVTFSGARVLVIDGAVEDVTWIDHILTEASTTGEPLVIVARGYTDQALATIVANTNMRRFTVVPTIVQMDVTTMNTPSDIATVCMSKHASARTGILPTSISWDDLKPVESLSLNSGMSIVNPLADRDIALLRSRLSEAANDVARDDIYAAQAQFAGRMRSLSASYVDVHFPRHMSLEAYELGRTIRVVHTLVHDSLVIDISAARERACGELTRVLLEAIPHDVMPARALVAMTARVLTDAHTISSIGAVVRQPTATQAHSVNSMTSSPALPAS